MIFNFTEEQFFSNEPKVIEGVAGIGKSSIVNDVCRRSEKRFAWTTSTHKLKRDAINRYGVDAFTVCSYLFNNRDGRFYVDFKQPDGVEIIIIDEILQTSPKVLDWIDVHKNLYNIIVMTDSHQMIARGTGRGINFVKTFNDWKFKQLYFEGKETKRARNQETKEKIEYLYNADPSSSDEFVKDLQSKRFRVMLLDDLDYDPNQVYITHKNVSEDYFYRTRNLNTRHFENDDVIPKGGIANKIPKYLNKYPIMSQLQAETTHATSYLQFANIGSATRYQGSEVIQGQTLYFIITPDSVISNREWYTVVSRCWDIDSIVIVVDTHEKDKSYKYRNRIIKDAKTLII